MLLNPAGQGHDTLLSRHQVVPCACRRTCAMSSQLLARQLSLQVSNPVTFCLQANVWTEYIADEETVEYMLLPRLCATAETLWSPKHTRDWPGFQLRLKHMMKRFDALDLRYRPLV